MNARRHRGFSLIEVLLATAILMGAIVVLGQLTSMGYRSAASARDEVAAQLICETILNEVVSGLRPAEEAVEQPVFDQPGWLYAVVVFPREQPNLLEVQVRVRQDLPPQKRPLEYRLSRWLYRPASQPGPELPFEQRPDAPSPMLLPQFDSSGGFAP
jgi:prepilin-type N-terminal cleavage/methylation domain-containing protein